MALRALARVNLAAIERNVARLRSGLVPSAGLCAVVKANGYGHGAVPVARAALDAGARLLAVATAEEAAELRAGGIEASVLVMGAISDQELPVALAAGGELVAWSERFVSDVMRAVSRPGPAPGAPLRMHVKLDTGMGRLGTRDPAEAMGVAELIAAAGPALELAGAMTHFASADEDPEFTAVQLSRFGSFVGELRGRWPGIVVHAANSAATLRAPASHFDLVRCGIAMYGCDPMNVDPDAHGLEPALELSSYVAAVKRAAPGESTGYGRRFVAEDETWIATVPIGYGDGIRRALTNNCDVLIGGRRYPLVGRVSMDNITIDMGPAGADRVTVGDRVTIIGRDGDSRQTAEEIARRIDTINYEIVCGLSTRVPRAYHRDGTPA
ncbi:MAG TPA: alanine racemase [Solirubrobacteraceae bacterium]|nr:alanine racemase [Solirubrobacteraceae bacterium]